MKEQTNYLAQFLRTIIDPKFILLCLALFWFLFLYLAIISSDLCFYNYSDSWDAAFSVLVAAFALWTGMFWGYVGSIAVSSPVVYPFFNVLFKVYRVFPLSLEEAEMSGSPADYWSFMQRHPEGLIHATLATIILCYASFCLIKLLFRNRRITS